MRAECASPAYGRGESEQLLALAESLLDFTTPDNLTVWLAANPPVAE